MAKSQHDPSVTIALFRKLQVFSPLAMLIAAGLCYSFASEDLKVMLAGIFVFLAVTEYFVFGFLIKQMESQK